MTKYSDDYSTDQVKHGGLQAYGVDSLRFDVHIYNPTSCARHRQHATTRPATRLHSIWY